MGMDIFSIDRMAAGAAGGLVSFLLGVKAGTVRNNKHVRKATLEIFGGMLTGNFIQFPFLLWSPTTTAFFLGVAWAGLAQVVRTCLTKYVERYLAKHMGQSDKLLPSEE